MADYKIKKMTKKVIIIILITAAIVIFFGVNNEKESSEDESSIVVTEKPNSTDSSRSIENDTINNIKKIEELKNIEIISKVKSGDNLTNLISKYGVTQSDLSSIAGQESVEFDFNNLHIDKKYKIILNPDSSIISFHYQATTSTIFSIIFTNPLKYSSSNSKLEDMKSDNTIENNNTNTGKEATIEISKKDFLTGKFDERNHPNFILLDNKYYRNSRKMYLQKETLESFIRMHESAKNDGISLIIVSGTRNFEVQKGIWEKKHKERKEKGMSDVEIIQDIMIWSSMPSTSRHHWGTDIDINSTDDAYFLSGKGEKVYKWLTENANKFGFCQVYNKKGDGRKTGYNEEKWHWSYMPLATGYLNEYKNLVSYKDINDFSSSYFAKELNIISEFVLGISKECASK